MDRAAISACRSYHGLVRLAVADGYSAESAARWAQKTLAARSGWSVVNRDHPYWPIWKKKKFVREFVGQA